MPWVQAPPVRIHLISMTFAATSLSQRRRTNTINGTTNRHRPVPVQLTIKYALCFEIPTLYPRHFLDDSATLCGQLRTSNNWNLWRHHWWNPQGSMLWYQYLLRVTFQVGGYDSSRVFLERNDMAENGSGWVPGKLIKWICIWYVCIYVRYTTINRNNTMVSQVCVRFMCAQRRSNTFEQYVLRQLYYFWLEEKSFNVKLFHLDSLLYAWPRVHYARGSWGLVALFAKYLPDTAQFRFCRKVLTETAALAGRKRSTKGAKNHASTYSMQYIRGGVNFETNGPPIVKEQSGFNSEFS